MPSIAAIKQKLALVRQRDVDLRCIAADRHRYKLNPVLPHDAVRRFERDRAIELPSDYVEFLTQLGNGGAGPPFGILPLGEFVRTEGDLSQPFPHRKPWKMEIPDDDLSVNSEEYQAWDAAYFDLKWISGALPICHQGCGHYALLVVNGPERGNMWRDQRVTQSGIRPIQTSGLRRVTFLEWYDSWLEECLEELDNF
jgi:hypothetical protein